jgi:transcriptional regulator with XRE-family HTH domain
MSGKSWDATGFRQRCFEARLFWERRNKRRLNQTELAELVRKAGGKKVSQSTISDWLNAVTVPGVDDIQALARAFGDVDPGWLAFGDASKAPRPGHDQTPELLPRRR